MSAGYPLKVTCSSSTLEMWADDELASYEDAGGWMNNPTPLDPPHVRDILTRKRTVLEMRSAAEVELVLKSADYFGDASGWSADGRQAYRAAVTRIAAKVRELEVTS